MCCFKALTYFGTLGVFIMIKPYIMAIGEWITSTRVTIFERVDVQQELI